MDKKKLLSILFILPEYYPHSGGGISTYYLEYLHAIKAYCKKIKVIVGSGYVQANDCFNETGINIEYLKPDLYQFYNSRFSKYDLLPEYRNNLAAAWAMWEQAKMGNDYDIIECTDFGLGFIPWVIHHDLPVITRLHGSSGQISLHEQPAEQGLLTSFLQQTELALLPLCDSLVTHSKTNQCFWQKTLPSVQINKFNPIYNTTGTPCPYSKRENFGLVTARLQKWKGPVQLFKAIGRLRDSPSIKWIGRDMPYSPELSTNAYLEKHFPDLWNKKIKILPVLPNKEVKSLQKTARFGVIPSSWDMFNFTCLEFLAAGTPIVCSDGAGASELIEHGKNGFKYPAGDDEKLAECIQQINELDEDSYMQLVSTGIHTIKSSLSANVLAPKYIQHYQSVLKNFNPTAPNIMLGSIYGPSEKAYTLGSALDKQPLKRIFFYLQRRLASKILKKWKL